MADTKTFGVKVPEELHQEASDLQKKLGLRGDAFLEELIRTYKIEKTKEQVPIIAEDLKELQALTSRIDNIYLNIAYRMDTLNKAKDEEIQEQLQKKDSIINDIQDKVATLDARNEELVVAYNNSVNQNDELEKRVIELTNMYNDNKALVEEYKSKNDTLTGLLNEYKAAKEENEDLKNRLNQSNLTNIQVNNDKIAKDKENEILKDSMNNLSAELQELKEQNKSEKEELKSQHKSDIEQLKEQSKEEIKKVIGDITKSKESEKREALLKIKEDHQEKVESIHNEYAAKINEYQEKYRDLLKEMEHIKESSIKTDYK